MIWLTERHIKAGLKVFVTGKGIELRHREYVVAKFPLHKTMPFDVRFQADRYLQRQNA